MFTAIWPVIFGQAGEVSATTPIEPWLAEINDNARIEPRNTSRAVVAVVGNIAARMRRSGRMLGKMSGE